MGKTPFGRAKIYIYIFARYTEIHLCENVIRKKWNNDYIMIIKSIVIIFLLYTREWNFIIAKYCEIIISIIHVLILPSTIVHEFKTKKSTFLNTVESLRVFAKIFHGSVSVRAMFEGSLIERDIYKDN